MLGASRESIEPGRLLIHTGYPMSPRDLADYADVRISVVNSALPKMLRLGMIAMDGDTIVILNWDERQFESDNVTARTQRYRAKTKEQGRNVPTSDVGTLQRRSRERSGNAPDTETETDNDSLRSSLRTQRAPNRRQAERLPDGWRPDPTIHSEMRVKFPHVNTEFETEKFKDYWHAKAGKDATKLDWQATWRNWIRTAAERTHTTNGTLQSRQQLEREAMFERQLARAREKDAANEPRTNSQTSTPHRSMLPGTETR
jgi:hypothetical protein